MARTKESKPGYAQRQAEKLAQLQGTRSTKISGTNDDTQAHRAQHPPSLERQRPNAHRVRGVGVSAAGPGVTRSVPQDGGDDDEEDEGEEERDDDEDEDESDGPHGGEEMHLDPAPEHNRLDGHEGRMREVQRGAHPTRRTVVLDREADRNGQRDWDRESSEEKDEAETELERLVFGDAAGFRAGLRGFGREERKGREVVRVEDEEDGEEGLEGVADGELFFTDTVGAGGKASATDFNREADEVSDDGSAKRKAAWHDSDDERIAVSLASVPRLRKLRLTADEDVVSGKEYIRRLRKQYTLLHPTPEWALVARDNHPAKRRRLSADSDDSASDMSVDDLDTDISANPLSDLLRSSSSLTARPNPSSKARPKFRPETLSIDRLPDLSPTQPSAVTSLTLHPTLPLLLSSGPSGTLYLHHIVPSPPSETANPLLTSLHLRSTALTTTVFVPHSDRILLSARRRYFHLWSLSTGTVEKITRVYGQQADQKSMETIKPSPCGRYLALKGSGRKGGGAVNVLDATTLQWLAQVRVESGQGVADFAWWGDGRGLCVAGKNGEVTEWEVEGERVVGRWMDEGAVGTTVVALGGDAGVKGKAAVVGSDRWVAVGSSSGVVNVYDRRGWYVDAREKAEQQKGKGGNGGGGEGGVAAAGGLDGGVVPRNPKPTKALDNLTTPISNLVFSSDAQLLAMSSKWKKDALKVVHLPTCTVYKNWPTAKTPLGRITGVAFGRLGGGGGGANGEGQGQGQGQGEVVEGLFVGNEAGKVRMWEIRA